ncbi:Uma2 family endonuclease [Streptomyces sp. NRRL B-1347]|uniref:Uma2 family endonuclease n=1 Tax=Streptomyces sp. NRRL B-1347 TaxID=1476877 RepID=UPI0004C5642B|nr:Uma2 family endonuclease [Streptomyces sp. NRRL B-1347]
MTPSFEERPQMSVEDFEELVHRAPETLRNQLEFLNGKLEVKPVPDQVHGAMVMWLLRQCMQQRPELALYPEQGLKVPTYRKGRARADGALAPLDHFVGQVGEWASPEGVLMAVEVTSCDRDADQRDRVEKPSAYAAAGIPVYLLVDRDSSEVIVHAEPKGGTYRSVIRRSFGETVELPDPVGFALDTEKLKEYAD